MTDNARQQITKKIKKRPRPAPAQDNETIYCTPCNRTLPECQDCYGTITISFETATIINGLLFVLATGGKIESIENRESARYGYNILNKLLIRKQEAQR